MSGSGLLARFAAKIGHLQSHHGLSAEVGDLRADLGAELGPLAAICVEEWTNPATAAAAALLAATASTLAAQTILEAGLLAPGKAELLARPRNLTFTTAGGTPADAPANVVITGLDAEGLAQTETVVISQTAATASGVKAWSRVTKIAYPVGDGVGATISIGYGIVIGLSKKIKARAGLTAAVKEISAGAVVTTGAFSAANKTYTPAAAPNGATSYAVYYEYDATVA